MLCSKTVNGASSSICCDNITLNCQFHTEQLETVFFFYFFFCLFDGRWLWSRFASKWRLPASTDQTTRYPAINTIPHKSKRYTTPTRDIPNWLITVLAFSIQLPSQWITQSSAKVSIHSIFVGCRIENAGKRVIVTRHNLWQTLLRWDELVLL